VSTKATIDIDYLRRIGAIVKLQGRDYLSHPGLLRVAHEHGLKGIECDLISWDAEGRAAVMRARAEGERGTYTAYGDASPKNVGKMIANATLRMAETRAVNRALRLYTGLGMTTTEELPGDHGESAKKASVKPEPGLTVNAAYAKLWGESGISRDEVDQFGVDNNERSLGDLTDAGRLQAVEWHQSPTGIARMKEWRAAQEVKATADSKRKPEMEPTVAEPLSVSDFYSKAADLLEHESPGPVTLFFKAVAEKTKAKLPEELDDADRWKSLDWLGSPSGRKNFDAWQAAEQARVEKDLF